MNGFQRMIALGLIVAGFTASRGDAAALDPTLPIYTSHSQGDVTLSRGNYAFQLGTSGPSLVFFNGPTFTTVATGFIDSNGINVFDFHSLQIAAGANIVVQQSSQSGPIALLSSTSINMGGSIDVSAGALVGVGPGAGPGAGNTGVGGAGQRGNQVNGVGPGGVIVTGGGGGGFGGLGQAGPDARIIDAVTGQTVGLLPGGSGGGRYESLADRLLGGSNGGHGGGIFSGGNDGSLLPGAFGYGGGAIELGAVQTVSVSGIITANGSSPAVGGNQLNGGGGGGSGGGIFLHGDSVNLSGTISAIGAYGAGGGNVLGGSGGQGSGGLVLAEYNGPYGSFTNTGSVNVGSGPYAGRFDAVSVPEPSSLILLGISTLGGIAAVRLRSPR